MTLKHIDPKTASVAFVNSVKSLSAAHPHSKVVVSKVAPVQDKKLNKRREKFNALVMADPSLDGIDNLSFISNDNILVGHHTLRADGIHPSRIGSSILAKNIGRHLNNLLWEKQRPRRRNPRPWQPQRRPQRGWQLSGDRPGGLERAHVRRRHPFLPPGMSAWHNPFAVLRDQWF